MLYKLCLVLFAFISVFGDDFDRINSSANQQMIHNMKNAKLCQSPAIAKENFSDNFKYGCFCGKDYPSIISKTKKSYKKLNRKEKDELIERYYSIKPYDDIDALCMKHDICYIYAGRKDQTCNDFLFEAMNDLSRGFYEVVKKDGVDSKAMRCQRLSTDIGDVFKTVFALSENRSIMGFGISMLINTPIKVVSKGIQKTSSGANGEAVYPLEGERCNYVLRR